MKKPLTYKQVQRLCAQSGLVDAIVKARQRQIDAWYKELTRLTGRGGFTVKLKG